MSASRSFGHSWQAMHEQITDRLKEQTGDDLETWSRRVHNDGPDDEAGLRAWLAERDITGYAQMLLVMERFGYPDFFEKDDAELIDGQYEDREHLRPILDHLLAIAKQRHPEVEIVGRKTYVLLYTPRRQFAVINSTTKRRVDLGLRLDGQELRGPLAVAKGLGNETIDVRTLENLDDVDDEVAGWLDAASEANL